MTALLDDLRTAARALRRRVSFTALAAGTLALGIGAATTIYTIVDGVLLAPLPYRESSQLTAVFRTIPRWQTVEGLAPRWNSLWFSYPAFRDWQSQQSVFESVGAWSNTQLVLTGTDGAEIVGVTRATASLASVLGIQPARGRFFVDGEDAPPGARVALVSHEAWQSRFGGEDLVGRTIRLEDEPYEVIGILPRGLDLTQRGQASDIWIAGGGDPGDLRAGSTNWFALGRLRSEASLAQATDETSRLVAMSSPPDSMGARVVSWHEQVTRSARRPLMLLLAGAGLLLLLAAVNVATVILGESGHRVRDGATHLALGAARGRIVRQYLLECALLGLAGALGGVVLAAGGTRALVTLMPYNLPRLGSAAMNWEVLLAAACASLLAALLAGLGPALRVARESAALRFGTSSRTTTRGEGRALRFLVGAQLALSCIILVPAVLLGLSLYRLSRVDPGFDSERKVLATLGITSARHESNEEGTATFLAAVAEQVAAVPGIDRASVGSAVPFSTTNSSSTFEVEGLPGAGATSIEARRSHVLAGFIETLGVRLLEGRTIRDDDRAGSPAVAVVNQTMARRFWPGASAIGRRISAGDDEWITIVGVVSDVHHTALGDSTRSTVYLPARQASTRYLSLLIESRLPMAAVSGAVRQAVAAVDASVPVTRVEEMSSLVRESFAPERYRSLLIGVFAALATLLAGVGTFGVTVRAVLQQRREIGIRMAVGSPGWRVVMLFVQRHGIAIVLGCGAGLLGAWGASRFVAPFLYETDATDPLTFASAAVFLVIVALLATWLPARRAASVHPTIVLRN